MLETGPLSIARASNHSMLLVHPHLSQCSLKEAPSVRLDFYSLPDSTAVSGGLAAQNETSFLWKLKFQCEFLAMTWGTELHELLIQKKLLG